jgi:hypothetical protein
MSRSMGAFERSVRLAIRRVRFFGTRRYCPVCGGYARYFLPATRAGTFGSNPRPDARCPFCYSLERHRLLWHYLRHMTDLLHRPDARLLHVAPERCLEPRLRERMGSGYVTGDLNRPADIKLDVTDLQFSASTFDAIICSHVLEHVPDDRAGMSEFHRVLRPGGSAFIMVPVTVEETVEDPTLSDPAERERLFGQDDHVRRYGMDIVDRLDAAGFHVNVIRAKDIFSAAEQVRLAIGSSATGDIFHCVRHD